MSARSMIRTRERELERTNRRNRRRAKQLSGGAAAALGSAILFAPAADAATFQVTNLNDAGAGSLRDAVAQANLAPDADVITFASGLSGTITLTTGEIPVYAAVDIQGPGANTLAVSGDDNSRIFYVDADNVGAERDAVSISGLTLAEGYDSGSGGAIYSTDTSLTLTGMTLRDNYAGSTGGAMYLESTPLTVTDSRLSRNVADSGGGAIYTDGDSDVDPGDTVTLTNSVLVNNYANGPGGAMYVDNATGGDVLIAGSEFSNNDANGSGGALLFYGHQGSSTIRNSAITGNSAQSDGGGIYFDSDYDDPDGLLVQNTTISGNRADGAGGGVSVENSDGKPVAFLNSTIADNRSSDFGGGIYRDDYDVTVNSTIVADNRYAGGDQDDLGEAAGATGSFITGFSLVERDASLVTITDNPLGSNKFGVDPQLGLLTNNGGPTLTQLPALSSPVIDSAIANGLTTDQRGLPRTIQQPSVPNAPGSDGTDMGAVEYPDVTFEGANISAKKKQKQKGKKIKVVVKVGAAEVTDAAASGAIKTGKKSYPLKDASANDIPAGTTKSLTLKPKAKKASKKIAKFLAGGKKGKATVDVLLTDTGGNTATDQVKVTLQGKSKKKKGKK